VGPRPFSKPAPTSAQAPKRSFCSAAVEGVAITCFHTVQYCTVLYSTVQYCTVLYSPKRLGLLAGSLLCRHLHAV